MKQLHYLVQIFAEMEQLQVTKNAKMAIQYNMMDTACTKCILGKCYECSTLGWYTDTSNWKCKEQCGDGLIIGTEQCEDLNTTDTDGCHNCRFFCRKGCSSCNYTTGTCLSCEQPGYEPYQYYCRNICGDGLIVDGLYGFYPEYCDDGNTDNSNYCNSSCEACAVGYTRSNVKICQPICGDSRKVVGEICETGLILPYKGCQSCKPKCQSICENCDTNGKGCLQCQLGYVNLNNVCHSICGDLIVTEAEECDDGNLIYGDGCHFCRFSCVKLCLSCINGVCYLYENDEDYDLSISKCLSVIGLNMKIDQQACLLFSDLIYFSRSYVKNIFQCHHKCQVCKFQTCYLCQQGYELTPNKQECRQSSILLDELKYCQISIGNFCYVCYDYAYFDIFENRCKLPSYSFQLIQQQCNQGYQLDDNGICVSSCGDGILTEEEECETQDENCLYCIYQQPYRCNYFFKDLCLECELGYQYDLMKKSCQVWREYKQIVMNEEEYNYLICQVELSGNCLKCEQGMCLECKQHSLFINGLCKEIQTPSELEIFNAEFDQDQHESLEQNEQQQQQLCDLNCNKCLNGFCEQCKNGFILNSIIQLCQASDFIQYVKIYDENTILDSVFNVNEHRCELLNNQIFVDDKFYVYDESCQRLRVNQQQSEEQIEQDSKTDNYEPCDQNCLFCNLGICSLCLKGSYIFNYECLQNGVVEYSQKEQVCGDKIVQIGEVCDDGNEFQYDGCFQCQFSCDENCSKCEYGICLICQIGFILDSTICKPFCGDGLAIPYKEECDDFNDSQGDGCDQCKFECVHNCLKCNQVHCYKCEKGYTNENDICVAKCGDSIVIPEYEQCDDGNKIMYDGCFNCQYQCSQNCLECYQGICTFACPDDKIVVDGICLQQCGKLIVSYNKECDDGNEIEYDGCFECKFQCINNCHSDFCKQGICTKCISGYFLYIQQCNISEMEENFESMLGNQQSSWICKDSECVFSESPKLALKSVGLQKEKYKLLIQFDQEVRCAFTECQDIFNIYFQEISEDQYNVQCSPFENQGFKNQDQVVWVEYLIEIEVFNPIKFSPTLIVILQQEILNQNQQNITTINYKLKLDKAIILEQNQKQTTAQMQLTSKAVVIASISLGALSLISGESTFVMELLNIIQYQSFLKFVNQEYPENLLIYFQASEMISVGPYLQVFNVDQLIEPILKKDEFIQLNGKFLYYELEPSIIINICPQIFQAFGIVLVMFSGKVLNILFVYIMSNQWLTSTLSNKNKLYSIIICKILKTIRKGIKLLQIQKYYFGLKQIKLLLLLNSWDLLFKSVLYLNSKKDETLRNIIESTMSLVIITTYFAVLIDCFQSCRPNKLISKAQRFDQIFVTLELCRTILFSVVLILFQSNQVLQTLLLYIGSFSQCFFIYKYKQVDQFGKILSILIEGSVSIFILTSIIYFKAFREYINPDIMTTVGFAHIGILLISSIILGVKQTIFTIKLFIKKFMKTKEN
ncbi:unnamed protein product [Paramecium octaurelia]|uniref:Transmembrane protein n=1 Tax=Paramecium octaurelia TaxID=43137 RepID=A0A8S1YHN4_PAROT|nr:unnamed protein product [Paramecium octaurelia]